MFRILLVALLAFGAWKGYEKYQSQRAAQQFQGIPQEIDISNNSSRDVLNNSVSRVLRD